MHTSPQNPFVSRLSPAQRMVLDDIRAQNQRRFGDDAFRMEGEEGGEGGAGGEGGDGSGAGAGAGGAGAGGAGTDDSKANTKEKLEDQPEWVQKMVKDLRAENATTRTTAKQTAAEEASKKVLEDVLKALGVKGNTEPTIDEVKAELERQRNETGTKDTQLSQAKIELAVYRTASKAGGDADALLDSRTFLEKVGKLDSSKDDFTDKLTAAIKDAVKDNPKLKASQAGAGSSSADHGSGGSGEGDTRKPKSLTDAVSGHYGT